MENLTNLKDYLGSSADKPLLSPTQERRLSRKAQAGCKRSKDELVERNLKLVIPTANKFRGQGLPFEDLIQEGNAGLIKAAERFDPDRGWRFSTYAVWWIYQSVSRAVTQQTRTIKIPVHVGEDRRLIGKARREFEAEHGKKPSLSELEAITGLTSEAIHWAGSIPKHSASLDAPLASRGDAGDSGNDTSSSTFGSVVPDDEQGGEVAGEAIPVIDRLEVGRALGGLPRHERWVMERYYGLGGEPPKTQQEIATEMGVVSQTVNVIVRRARNRLSQRLRAHGFREAS